MSIRDELVSIITQADSDVDERSFPDRIADAILDRYGVVELPQSLPIPDGYNSDDSAAKCIGVFPWSGMFGELTAWTDGRIHDEIGGMTADEARRDAASLLAAANRVEAQS